jgi:diadenosine tetraphosphatase ApaH/serine/threonine PP2A family protein phosphatase
MRKNPERTIIIGDVHGCHLELAQLLRDADVVAGRDRVIFIGDLINKGPGSRKVWEIFQRVQGEAIMGNHEWSMLQLLEGDSNKHAKYRSRLEKDFGDELEPFVCSVREWPLWLDLGDYLLVHAGLVPGMPPSQTDPWILTTIRTWDGRGADLVDTRNPRWFDLYHGQQTVVFGHWAALGGLIRDNAIGLDTGCVYGGMLTALVLPERRFVRVKARECYCLIRS